MYKLSFFVPESHVEQVKTAVFEAGGGRLGDYDCCAWQILGQGQFRPLEGSDPHTGKHQELTKADEYKVEMVCEDDHIRGAIAALRLAHPYEEPAFDVWPLTDPDTL